MNYGWRFMTLYRRHGDQDHPHGKEMQKSKMAVWGGLTKWNEARQRLIVYCQENALVIANTLFQQQKRRFYTWTSPDGQH